MNLINIYLTTKGFLISIKTAKFEVILFYF